MSASSSSLRPGSSRGKHNGLATALAGIEFEAGSAITWLYDASRAGHTKNERSSTNKADIRVEAIILDWLVRDLRRGPILSMQAVSVRATRKPLQ
jgi:hypothetical protein